MKSSRDFHCFRIVTVSLETIIDRAVRKTLFFHLINLSLEISFSLLKSMSIFKKTKFVVYSSIQLFLS